ncbi:MAG: hypothetical protein M3Z64_03880, partial [Verrucomicrobiota bacterium]|nr:hypothetical protein [Verrucomicrobiota bacterium]
RRNETASAAPTSHRGQPAAERDMPSFFQWAAAGYRRLPYCGPVALLLSEDVTDGKANPAAAWRRLAPKSTVHPLPGTHLECITEHVETLAERIQAILQKNGPGG